MFCNEPRFPQELTSRPSPPQPGIAAPGITTREAAQSRIDQIEVFERELAQLRVDRVIQLSEPQATAIDAYHRTLIGELTARYDADTTEGGRQLSMSMRLISVIGAFLVGFSIFFCFYHFWAAFHLVTQSALLCAAPTLTLGLALVVRARDRTGYFSRLSAALCYASFVLTVVVLPPLWNVDMGSVAVLACTVFGFILAYEMRSRLQLCAAMLGVVIFGAASITTMGGAPWWACVERPENFFAGALLLLLVPLLRSQERHADFAALYRLFGTFTLFGTLVVLACWPSLSYFEYDAVTVSGGYKWALLALGAVGIYVGTARRLPEISIVSSLALLVLCGLQAYGWLLPRLPPYQFFLVMSALALGALYVLNVLRGWEALRTAAGSR